MTLRALFALLLTCALLFTNLRSAEAQVPTPSGALIPELLGRWDVSFRSAEANVDTVWVIEPSAGGATSIGTLGKNAAGLAVLDAAIAGDVVNLAGTSAAGPLAITSTLSGDQLQGRFTAGPIAGTFLAIRRPDARARDLTALFDQRRRPSPPRCSHQRPSTRRGRPSGPN